MRLMRLIQRAIERKGDDGSPSQPETCARKGFLEGHDEVGEVDGSHCTRQEEARLPLEPSVSTVVAGFASTRGKRRRSKEDLKWTR